MTQDEAGYEWRREGAMRGRTRSLSVGLAAVLALTVAGTTQADLRMVIAGETDQAMLQAALTAVDKEANTQKGEQVVVGMLKRQFRVDDARIAGLRARNLTYGEIAIALTLAKRLQGRADANVQTVLAMREGPPVMGWGEIAHQLGTKLGLVVGRVVEVAGKSHEQLGQGLATGMKRAEPPPIPESPDRLERRDPLTP